MDFDNVYKHTHTFRKKKNKKKASDIQSTLRQFLVSNYTVSNGSKEVRVVLVSLGKPLD